MLIDWLLVKAKKGKANKGQVCFNPEWLVHYILTLNNCGAADVAVTTECI